MVRYYTREAGVRALEREIAKVCRKMVKAFALGEETGTGEIDNAMVADLLGVQKYNYGIAEEENKIGQVTGLAWTSVGGELLTIEAVAVAGKGLHLKTGSLGDVMQEQIYVFHFRKKMLCIMHFNILAMFSMLQRRN